MHADKDNRLLAAMRARPGQIALASEAGAMTCAELLDSVDEFAARLTALGTRVLGIWAGNSAAWVIADLAGLVANCTIVPLPTFFSAAQIRHAVEDAGVDTIVCDTPAMTALLPGAWTRRRTPLPLALATRTVRNPWPFPAAVHKITYTSGSTGHPKGVCLGWRALEDVITGLSHALSGVRLTRHLAVLPLSTLLENVAGVYFSLFRGAAVQIPAPQAAGFGKNSRPNAGAFTNCLRDSGADSVILTPQLLKMAVQHSRSRGGCGSFRFVALGGGCCSKALIADARQLGLPVHEGYGLSECGSVVSLNTPGHDKPGSVGRVLAHKSARLAADGEIIISGNNMLGYAGNGLAIGADIRTGDIGHIDDDGFLFITGRKKDIFVTAGGRNVSPEWVEKELLRFPEILQAAVFGDASETNTAWIVASGGVSAEAIDARVREANRALPDYARVHDWRPAPAMFSPENGLLTANGKPRRAAIRRCLGGAAAASGAFHATHRLSMQH